jgi:UDP-3-O-acyl-N-acetylglucosamine deacetylase
MMVEHLLAACMGLEVKALTVETDAEELPIGDGSSLLWCNAFGAAGLRRLDADAASMGVPNPISVTDEEASITLEPASEWHLEYRGVFFDGSEQSVIWRSGSDFKHDIAPARTFCRLSEALYLRERGLIAGGSLDNAVLWVDDYGKESETVAAELGLHNLMVTEEHLPFPQRLRFPDEFARHKLQDLMGDLMLARNLAPCSVTARMSGHELNHALLHALRDANTLS